MTSQHRISRDLGVLAAFDLPTEIERRVAFLAGTLMASGQHALVLAISGGIDSAVAGRLCQLAAASARDAGHDAAFVAMRLPYGVQRDEADAQLALEFIRPDRVLAVDIRSASDATLSALLDAGLVFRDQEHQDFVLGNIKARERMIAQYAVANAIGGLVVGTDHAAEAVTGFFTKFGDGAADVVPLTGLTKRRVRAVGAALGVPPALIGKTPTADLESLAPSRPDEDVFGFSYDDVDDFLEGRKVPDKVERAIVERYRSTEHKRDQPIAP